MLLIVHKILCRLILLPLACDHETVVAVRKINSCKLPQRAVECRDYSRYNSTAFCDDLSVCNWDSVFETDDVNDAWLKWKDIFLNICDKHAPPSQKVSERYEMSLAHSRNKR